MARLRSETPDSPIGGTGNSESKRKKARVPIYKNADGTLDLSGLSDEDAESVRQRFGGAGAGVPPQPAAAPPPVAEPIDPAIIGMALGLLTSIEAAVVGKRFNIPTDKTFEVLRLKPPFDELVTNAACKVANKYVGSLGPYADEIALFALLATWQIGAYGELQRMAATMAQDKAETPPPNVDHDRHKSPPPTPKPEPTEPPKSNVVPIDLLIGAQLATGGAGSVGAGY